MADDTTATTTSEEEPEKDKNYFVIGLVIVAVLVLVGILINNIRKGGDSTKSGGTTISGTVNFNGLKPKGGEDSIGEMFLMQREVGATDYTKTDIQIPMEDNAPWSWDGAKEGTTYNLKIDLYLAGEFIKSSSVITVTAPATDQVLTLSVTLKDVPDYIIEDAEVSISGTTDLNGPIPEGSTVTVYQKLAIEKEYSTAVADIPAVDQGKWSWDKAIPGQEYDLMATLIYKDKEIGESKTIMLVAPASGEVLKIDTTYKPEAGEKAVIAGKVRLVGLVAQDSTILLLVRTPDEEEYEAVERYPAVNNTEFIWDGAVSGQQYYVTAALQVGGENTSSGNVLFVTAPATNELITIDTQMSLEAPKNAPTITCGDPDSTGNYNAALSYESIGGALGYYLEAGTKPGEKDVLGEVQKSEEEVAAKVTIYAKKDQDYFTQYAYTYCSDCNVFNNTNWSSFSPTLGFTCPQ
jgi:hypothetical protein